MGYDVVETISPSFKGLRLAPKSLSRECCQHPPRELNALRRPLPHITGFDVLTNLIEIHK
jgi:hypothetical protein